MKQALNAARKLLQLRRRTAPPATHPVTEYQDRARARDFIDLHLHEQNAVCIPVTAEEEQDGIPALVRVSEDRDGALCGAIFASNDPEDVRFFRSRGHLELAETIRQQMLMIHQLVVAPTSRRTGLGSALLNDVVNDATKAGATIACLAFDDTREGLAEFYAQNGFSILQRGAMLGVIFAGLPPTGFPQAEPRYRWAFRVLNPTAVGAGACAPH